MTTKAKYVEVADVREMLTGALDDIANLTRYMQEVADSMRDVTDNAAALAKVETMLATLQQAKLAQQRVEWEVDAATTYLRTIVRQQADSQSV